MNKVINNISKLMSKSGVISALALAWVVLGLVQPALASGGTDMSAHLNLLVIQLGVIIIAAWCGGKIFERIKLPSVLGEIIAGVVIGPFGLGQLSVWGFSGGLFPIASASFPVSIELYSLATIASVFLLFFIGLETDMEKFIQFSVPGFVIGFFGVVISFMGGDLVGMWYAESILKQDYGFFHPLCMFFGVISTATSVGISARILSDKRKMNSPEGVTILSAAVIDDILGLVILATVIGMVQTHDVSVSAIALTATKSIAFWVIVTGLGLLFAHQISRWLKASKDAVSVTLMSLAMAMIAAGVFEKSGLAMIIGAYSAGLVLSKTDIAYLVQEKMHVLQRFFVPIFFCVMGMMIDLKVLFSPSIMLFGLIYIVVAVIAKFVGCSVPALFCNFNRRGAAMIGLGMVPRGEVALIVAGIGLSKGIIDDQAFSIAVIMTFFTTLMVPPLLARMFESDEPVLKNELAPNLELINVHFAMPNPDTAEFIQRKILEAFRHEGFHAHRQRHGIYFLRREKMFITMRYSRYEISFECLKGYEPFVNTLFFEVVAELERFKTTLKSFTDHQQIGQKIFVSTGAKDADRKNDHLFAALHRSGVQVDIAGDNKTDIINGLVDLATHSLKVSPEMSQRIRDEVFQRETVLSTAMQNGIVFPHAKLEFLHDLCMCVATKSEGVDCQSLDGASSQIFILLLVPTKHNEQYLQLLSKMCQFLSVAEHRQRILSAQSNAELFDYLSQV